jgi:F-type H+-transporting ATPase subunit gamma
MPAIIDLRRRIKSVKNTQQITQAMKSVATAKFKKAQKCVLEGRPHWHNFPEMMAKVSAGVGPGLHPLLQKREEKKIICLVFTSDKGLCGAFNSNLLAEAHDFLEKKAANADVSLVPFGKKAATYFEKHPFVKDRVYADDIHKLSGEELRELAQDLMRMYVFNRIDAVYAVYNEFKSILAPKITLVKLLPLEAPDGHVENRAPPVTSNLFSLFISKIRFAIFFMNLRPPNRPRA